MKPFLACIFMVALLTGCSRQASVSSLAGSYYRGDHKGYNINLDLLTSGRYKAEWRGCCGLYGTASGTWAVGGDRVILSPSTETDMMKGHLRELHIVHTHGQSVFVPDLHDDYYRKFGADDYSAFHKQKK